MRIIGGILRKRRFLAQILAQNVYSIQFQQNLDDENTLEAFRLDVATFRKTRHENLVSITTILLSLNLQIPFQP